MRPSRSATSRLSSSLHLLASPHQSHPPRSLHTFHVHVHGWLTFTFHAWQAIIQLPGDIIADSIVSSRTATDGEKPNYLHVNDECEIDPTTHRLLSVDGEEFDPDRMYVVSIYQFLLTGMNAIEPLVSRARDHTVVLPSSRLTVRPCPVPS